MKPSHLIFLLPLDFREFMLVFQLLMDGTAEEKIKRVFDLCDKDKDGTVSYKELKQFLSLFWDKKGNHFNSQEPKK